MEQEITVNGTTLNVTERGSGDIALVFLHFYGGSGQTWNEVIDVLETDFRCIAPDLRGFGRSPAAPDGDYSVDMNAADILGLIGQMGLQRYVLVGHSMGGKFALAATARLCGQNVMSAPLALVLLAPSPPTPEPMTDADREASRRGQGDPEAAAKTLEKITARPLPDPIARRTVDDMVRASRPAWLAWLDGGSQENISDRMSEISVPVYVLSGTEDHVIPTDVLQKELIARIPESRLTSVPGAGHLLPLEATSTVVPCIREAAENRQ